MMDYKKYSLEKLQDWVHDAMSSDASPHEIYSAIREAVREDYYYHKDRISRASGLLELMSGHRPVAENNNTVEDKTNPWYDYFNNSGEGNTIVCDKDDPRKECQNAWNDFWEENYYPEEHKSNVKSDKWHQSSYISEDGDLFGSKQDKVVKWQLPVDEVQNAETGEYECFVTFPDDLLKAADLKEGDTVEWVDQGDGSYLLRKV